MIEFLDYKSLGKAHNGLLEAAFLKAMQEVWRDMDDRPNAKGKRKITIEVTFLAEGTENNELVGSAYEWDVKTAIPGRKSPAVHVQIGNGGRPVINVDQGPTDHPRQTTLSQVTIGPNEDGNETMNIITEPTE